jgi:hypothetical protein
MSQPQPFNAQTLTYSFSATGSAGTPVQIKAISGSSTGFSSYLVQNTGAVGAWVILASTSALAAQTLPIVGTPGNSIWVPAGATMPLSGAPQAFFNAQTISGTASLSVTGGEGASSASGGLGSSSAPTSTIPGAPASANILAGVATANAAMIITIPAGRTWVGTVSLSASVVVASAGAAVTASARVSTAGTGVVPAAGDYLRLDLNAPASAAAAAGTKDSGQISTPMTVVAPAGNAVTLVLNVTNTTVQSASANGALI